MYYHMFYTLDDILLLRCCQTAFSVIEANCRLNEKNTKARAAHRVALLLCKKQKGA